ncbi:MAG: energy transducer TonB [Cytophagaceae bacterium]|jgi:protein TonB|nr:energy transducer TonB [Cytophagaceae bacterium]
METSELYKATLDEIVFDDRNKYFGGYFLRINYKRNITVASLLIFLTFSLVGVAIHYKMQQVEQVEELTLLEVDMTALETKPIEPEQKELPPPPPPPKVEPPKIELVKFVPPVIKPDNMVQNEEPIKKDTELENVQTGNKNQEGEKSLNNLNVEETDDGVIGGSGQDTKVYDFVEERPTFEGDNTGEAFRKYLMNRIMYPEAAKAKGITGVVYVEYTVTSAGDVTNVRVVRGIPELNEAAMDAFKKKMPKFSPGKNNGTAVNVKQVVPIEFRLK